VSLLAACWIEGVATYGFGTSGLGRGRALACGEALRFAGNVSPRFRGISYSCPTSSLIVSILSIRSVGIFGVSCSNPPWT
jgi:hypothetical protein